MATTQTGWTTWAEGMLDIAESKGLTAAGKPVSIETLQLIARAAQDRKLIERACAVLATRSFY